MTALPRRRLLFLYSSTGAGHRSAALAVREALVQRYGPAAEVALCDGLQATGRWPFDHFPRWWPAMVRLGGMPWGAFYRLTNHPAIPRSMARLLLPYTAPPLTRLLAEHPAEIIVSFHPLFTHTVSAVLRRSDSQTPLVSVVLDLVNIHTAWCAPDCARIFVPTAEAAARAVAWGMSPARVQCAGLPTHPRFAAAAHLERAAARAPLGLPPTGPVILATGGGDAGGSLLKVIQTLARRLPHAHIVAIAGNNSALQRALARQHPAVRVEGFTENMELWMRAADVLLTKAGPNTLAEALVLGLPMVLYRAIPGQETGNAAWVTAHGAGLWAPRPTRAAAAVAALLADDTRRANMAAAALRLAQPAAAAAIGEALWQLAV